VAGSDVANDAARSRSFFSVARALAAVRIPSRHQDLMDHAPALRRVTETRTIVASTPWRIQHSRGRSPLEERERLRHRGKRSPEGIPHTEDNQTAAIGRH
jgi:hypothetical protein